MSTQAVPATPLRIVPVVGEVNAAEAARDRAHAHAVGGYARPELFMDSDFPRSQGAPPVTLDDVRAAFEDFRARVADNFVRHAERVTKLEGRLREAERTVESMAVVIELQAQVAKNHDRRVRNLEAVAETHADLITGPALVAEMLLNERQDGAR